MRTALLAVGLGGCTGLADRLESARVCGDRAETTDRWSQGRTASWTLTCANEPAQSGTFALGPAAARDDMPCQGTLASECVLCAPEVGGACPTTMWSTMASPANSLAP